MLFQIFIIIGLSTKFSSTKDAFLEGGVLSLNVVFNDSSTLWVFLLKTLKVFIVFEKVQEVQHHKTMCLYLMCWSWMFLTCMSPKHLDVFQCDYFHFICFMWDFLKITFDIKHNLRHEIWCFKNVVNQTFVLQASQRCKTFLLMKFLVSLLVNKSYVRLTQEFLVFYLLMVKEPKHLISPTSTSC